MGAVLTARLFIPYEETAQSPSLPPFIPTPKVANGSIYRPVDSRSIDKQIAIWLKDLREEYMVPPQKATYYDIAGFRTRESQKLMLLAIWKREDMLAQARAGFDRLAD